MKTDNVVEGPLGLKMSESVARVIERVQKSAPSGDEFKFRRVSAKSAEFKLDSDSRTDVSYITTEDVDREDEVVVSKGVDLADYNGVVTWAHKYDIPPVGRSQWIKAHGNGLIAKSAYAARPKGWTSDWLPDAIISLMQMDPPSCTGKSIGFIPLRAHLPTAKEMAERPELKKNGVLIIDKCALLEYAVAPIPVNQAAEMIAVSKSFSAEIAEIMGLRESTVTPPVRTGTAYVTPETVAKAVADRLRAETPKLLEQFKAELIERLMLKMGRP